MRVDRRIAAAFAVLGFIILAVVAGRWYETRRSAPGTAAGSSEKAVIPVTNPSDHGAGTLREALFIAASSAKPARIVIDVAGIKVETALPPLVSAHGISVTARQPDTLIDARALAAGPVFDVAGPDDSIEGLRIINCVAAAVLVRAARFRMDSASIASCDVGVEVAENANDTRLTRNRFDKNRVSIRFAAADRTTVVEQNYFSHDRDAGVWAVRGESGAVMEPIMVHDNHFANEPTAVVAGNVPIAIERNDITGSSDVAVHIIGADAVIRGNRISGGSLMGVVVENGRGIIVEANEIDGFKAYGIMVRGSSNTLLRKNRLHNCGYGIAFVLGDPNAPSSAVENAIIEPKLNGIDVLGDSPLLRRNQVLRPHGVALHLEDFQTPGGQKVRSRPFLDNNTFGIGGADPPLRGDVTTGSERHAAK